MLEFYHNETWHPVADLELISLVRTENDRAAHTVDFSIDLPLTQAAPYAIGDLIAIRNNGTVEFVGTIRSKSRNGTVVSFSAPNVWWFFENITHEVDWEFEATAYSASHVTLCRDENGDEQTVGWQIQKAVERAASEGAPVTFITDDLDLMNALLPVDEAYDLSCAEVIQKMVRWYPNTAICFDYPADPTEATAIRFIRDDAADTVELSVEQLQSLSIRETEKLVTGVRIVYEVTTALINGETTDIIIDAAGVQSGPGVMVLTKDIHDGSFVESTIIPGTDPYTITETTNLVVSDLPSPWYGNWQWCFARANRSTWWVEGYCSTNSKSPSTNPSPSKYIVSGYKDGFGISRTYQLFSVSYEMNNGGGCVFSSETVNLSFGLYLTSSPSGTYYKYTDVPGTPDETEYSIVPGEAPPNGVAGQLLLAQNEQRHQGNAMLFDELNSLSHSGRQKLNFTGGESDWENIQAVVQQIKRDYMTDMVSVSFGRPRHLGADDFIKFLQFGRQIRRPNRDR
jgi:hypothetical protein